MFDPGRDLEWTRGITASRVASDGPFGTSTSVERVARFLGRELAHRYEVTAFERDNLVAMTVTRPFPMDVRYELEDVPEGTRVRIRASGNPGGFFGPWSPLLRRMVKRNISRDLAAPQGAAREREHGALKGRQLSRLTPAGTVAEIRLEDLASRTPGEDAPTLSALGKEAHRCRHAAPVGAPDRPGVDAHDARAAAFEIAGHSEPLDARRGRPLEREPIEDDVGSSPLLRCRRRDARGTSRRGEDQGCGHEGDEREHASLRHSPTTPPDESYVTF